MGPIRNLRIAMQTEILATFVISLVIAIVLTPLIIRLGRHFGALDHPGDRKVHTKPIPRIGGLAIAAAFALAVSLSTLLPFDTPGEHLLETKWLGFFLGLLICFGIGLIDDFHSLGARVKFFCQVAGATAAFLSGIHIDQVFFLEGPLHVIPSYLATVFWFVLFINAVNLIDGLDGLAGGICLFASVILVFLSIPRGEYQIALLYAALAGSTLGFLRYNFNPASIFMGDGGTYFLGYAIAGLSIIGSQKSQVGATMLIPLLALGVPVFDALLSPIRRFAMGKAMFKPDQGHIHHRLVSMGFSAKKAVMTIYGITLALCVLAIILVNVRDRQAGLLLTLLGAGVLVLTRKLGYFQYLAYDKLYGWFRDVSDVAGFTRDRRSFLSLQLEIGASKSLEELWGNVGRALDMLKFDRAVLTLHGYNGAGGDGKGKGVGKMRMERQFTWEGGDNLSSARENRNGLLKLEMPLIDPAQKNIGALYLVKDVRRDPISHYTLRRVEHLRRSLVNVLAGSAGDGILN